MGLLIQHKGDAYSGPPSPRISVPERCALIAENEILGTSYRHLLYGRYRTIFRIAGRTVVILRVIHGARLLDESLFEG